MIFFFPHWNLNRAFEKAFWETDFWPKFPFQNEGPVLPCVFCILAFGFFLSGGGQIG